MIIRRVTGAYFSPTGNTEKLAKAMAGALGDISGLPVEYIDFTLSDARSREYAFGREDLLVIGLPVYAGRLPNKILPFVQENMKGDGTLSLPFVCYGNRSFDDGLSELVFEQTLTGFRPAAAAAFATQHAFATALAVSGMETGRFTFEGFLSVNKKSRRDHLEELENERRTMVFYEAPHKLINTLNDFYATFGDRKIALVRELTKIHEEVINTTLSKAVKMYETEKPKGEFVLILEGKKESEETVTPEKAVEMAKALVENGMSVNAAAKEIAAATGVKKNEIYKALL